jgi:hypothetical protein
MTPKQVTTIDLSELKEIELRCECGASIRLPLPLKNDNLVAEQMCPSCPRAMWAHGSPVRDKIQKLLSSITNWNDAGYKDLALRFILTEPLERSPQLLSSK